MDRIRVAIVGVGNCASSLVQGVEFYRDAAADETIPGLMHPVLGDYAIDDIQFVAAFDVDATKVGQDLSKAILAGENNTTAFAEVPQLDVTVQRGPTLDGIGAYLTGVVEESAAPEVDVAGELRKARADVVVSYLPVGSQQATEFYASQALEAGCAFVNCIPVFIARTGEWAEHRDNRQGNVPAPAEKVDRDGAGNYADKNWLADGPGHDCDEEKLPQGMDPDHGEQADAQDERSGDHKLPGAVPVDQPANHGP